MPNSLSEYRPRLTIDLRQDQINDLRNLLDWGVRSRVFEPIIDDFITLLKKDRAAVVSLLLSREMKLSDMYAKELTNGDD